MQVPFYFKSIVDSMNLDFAALGGTAWSVGGAMIVACTDSPLELIPLLMDLFRWCYQNRGGCFPGNEKCHICKRCSESHSPGRMQCV